MRKVPSASIILHIIPMRYFYYFLTLLLSLFLGCTDSYEDQYINEIQADAVLFSAIGDVPYSDDEKVLLSEQIESHNDSSKSVFVIHLGDIKTGAQECEEQRYINVSNQLKTFETQTFIIPGDNEYNDCDNPKQGWFLWRSYFYRFHEFWQNPYPVNYHEQRGENFSFKANDVLFIGLNIVGGTVHDEDEWNERLTQNGEWYQSLLESNKDSVSAVVVFGHANITDFDPEKFELFTPTFVEASREFGKPVLYLHGDGHTWIKDKPFEASNIYRVQVNEGGQILQVKVTPGLDDPFIYNRKAF